jgi:hypothetical protein
MACFTCIEYAFGTLGANGNYGSEEQGARSEEQRVRSKERKKKGTGNHCESGYLFAIPHPATQKSEEQGVRECASDFKPTTYKSIFFT